MRASCPHFVPDQHEIAGLCVAMMVPFQPSGKDRLKYCETSRHRQCSLYRESGSHLTQAIRQEVARAIG